MIIDNEEKKEAIRLMDEYRTVHEQIVILEEEIEDLGKRKDNLVEELKSLREEDKYFMNILVEKYGPENVNIEELKKLVI